MSAYEGQTQRLELPCPVCGGDEFTWGTVGGGGGYPSFAPPSKGWFGLLQLSIPIAAARHCETCGNVQMSTRDWSKPHPRDVD